mgnify:CR=1 FL=1
MRHLFSLTALSGEVLAHLLLSAELSVAAGDSSQDAQAAFDPRSFPAKPRWQRLIIAFAGPAMNIFLAIGLLAGLYMNRFPKEFGVTFVKAATARDYKLINTPAFKKWCSDNSSLMAALR